MDNLDTTQLIARHNQYTARRAAARKLATGRDKAQLVTGYTRRLIAIEAELTARRDAWQATADDVSDRLFVERTNSGYSAYIEYLSQIEATAREMVDTITAIIPPARVAPVAHPDRWHLFT